MQIEENFQKNSQKIAISDPKRYNKLKVQNNLKSPLRALDKSNEEFKVLLPRWDFASEKNTYVYHLRIENNEKFDFNLEIVKKL